MSAEHKNLSDYHSDIIHNVSGFRFGIVVSDYNSAITYALRDACRDTLLKHGAHANDIIVWHVSGAFELPLAAQLLYEKAKPDALICLGCVVKGETRHDEYINQAVANALMKLGLKYSCPFVFGVLTTNTMQQAEDRAGGKHGNKGIEAAIAAIRMAVLGTYAFSLGKKNLK